MKTVQNFLLIFFICFGAAVVGCGSSAVPEYSPELEEKMNKDLEKVHQQEEQQQGN